MEPMHYYEVAPNRIIRPGSDTFTYHAETAYDTGCIVEVPVGTKNTVGVIVAKVPKPEYATKAILRLVESQPLPHQILGLAVWMSRYYASPLATVLQTILPSGITKTRRKTALTTTSHVRKRTKIVLNKDQRDAIKKIQTMDAGACLLHGITGSGKTVVYRELAKHAIDAGRSVIIIVPEIALTSQLVADFSHDFGEVILTHSRQTEAERHISWKEALTSSTPRIVIGPRSALFMPLANVGLVVIDECHEPSLQQEQTPRYSALRAASKLAEHHQAKAVFGSATPLVSDYYIAQSARRPIISMEQLAMRNAVKPDISVIDMTKRTGFKRHRFLSDKLLGLLETTFENGKQALIFHNRRGSASSTLCENCGWQAGCPRCYIPLTLHADKHALRCHICGYTDKVPTSCPVCHHVDIIHKGIGTKLIESELKKLFPEQTIARFDGDTGKADSMEANYSKLYDGSIDIIIGTQVIAKGLDLPHLRTVGIVQADAGLSLPDYSSSERTFQLLSQAIGRVGRSHHKTDVVVQSYQPTHPAVVDGIGQAYDNFYERTLAMRKQTKFPPFTFLLKLTCVYKTEAAAVKNARSLAEVLRVHKHPSVEILGPTPAFYERTRDTYRWQLVVKSAQRAELIALLDHVPTQHWQYELDPLSLL